MKVEEKQKREMEMEVSHVELQSMEKTLEINENNQILQDLERLRYVPPDHIPSYGDETGFIHSQDGMESFPL
jgi:hypothetical protein